MILPPSGSRETRSVVPAALHGCFRLPPGLPRKAKPPFQGLWVGILLCVAGTPHAFAADHPQLPKGSECLSCHVEKTRGQSVHFDFAHACTVCHAVTAADGKTPITLVLPKETICYSCHEKAAMDKVPYMNGECISCHDPHNSQRLYLLRANVSMANHGPKP